MRRRRGAALRLAFFGTPAFALPALRRLAAAFTVGLVVTQPDRPAGRQHKLRPPPVAELAGELGLPLIQPENPNLRQTRDRIAAANPDVLVVVAYGRMIRRALRSLRSAGAVNLHPSLLPAHRGASPIQAALYEGRDRTGVTLMRLDAGLDSGPLIAARSLPIDPATTAPDLHDALAEAGAALLEATLPEWVAEALDARPQDASAATVTRPLARTDAELDIRRSAHDLYNQWRAFQPWPGSSIQAGEIRCKLHALGAPSAGRSDPGRVRLVSGMLSLACADGELMIESLQPAGHRVMSARDFANGYPSLLDRSWGRPYPVAPEPLVRPAEA